MARRLNSFGLGNRVAGSAAPVAPRVTPCFTPGTLIATPTGVKPVQLLREGEAVLTRDNGPQAIRWVGHRHLLGDELAANRHLQPVLIKAGALGDNLPDRDMLVSPNHRVLVSSERTALYFEEREVLVAAKHLVNHRTVQDAMPGRTSYIHFLFDRHEVVLSDGTWSESFQPGDASLNGVGNAQRLELYEIFPELRERIYTKRYPAARKVLTAQEARRLME